MEAVRMKEQKCKRFLLYWHKGANSGLWQYDKREYAFEIANDLAKQESMYRVTIIDTTEQKEYIVKTTD